MPVKPGWEGRYFEDFEVGDVYRSSIGRTITDAENTIVTLLTNNDNQIHFNPNPPPGRETASGWCYGARSRY
jgi:itaconyl-CoA hydratase